MKKIDNFTGKYKQTKTLCFSLIPEGRTLEHFELRRLLEEDERLAKDYTVVKGYMDRYHRDYIARNLETVCLRDYIAEYADVYYGKDAKREEKLDKLAEQMRKTISGHLTGTDEYKKMFGQEMVKQLLPGYLTDDEERKTVARFERFTTYFKGFYDNRKNIYSADKQITAIGNRLVEENLPCFLDNARILAHIMKALPAEVCRKLDELSYETERCGIDVFTRPDAYNSLLRQEDIDRYNVLIGGYTAQEGNVQGINQYVEQYNQVHGKNERLPRLKQLYKQILSEKQSASFVRESFTSDDELIQAVAGYLESVKPCLEDLQRIFDGMEQYEQKGIYLCTGAGMNEYVSKAFGLWHILQDGWYARYDRDNLKKTKTYEEKREKAFKAIKSISFAEIIELTEMALRKYDTIQPKVPALFYKEEGSAAIEKIKSCCCNAEKLLSRTYSEEKRLSQNNMAIEQIRELLDNFKGLEWLLKPLAGTGKEEERDDRFYGDFYPVYEALKELDGLYDKVRDYVTKKPYSTDKIKLNFGNPQLLGGWDKNKEADYSAVVLRKGSFYFLGIMDKDSRHIFEGKQPDGQTADCYEKMNYKLLPGPNKMLPKVFFADANIERYAPSPEILRIKEKETFKKTGGNFKIEDCRKLIDFYKKSIALHPDWKNFGFSFRPTAEYADISEFYHDVEEQGYSICFDRIPSDYVDSLVEKGALYLFRLHNKDFSPASKGTPNMHTLYFRMLFDPRNLYDVVYKLNGEAEMFYRKGGIPPAERIIHPAGKAIKNKNPDNIKAQSVFSYDLIKDKRYTQPQFSLHLPITMNFKAPGDRRLNQEVRQALKECPDNYIIGIDRGERNLIYVCVIDGMGNIIEQYSLNEIVNEYRGQIHTVDYRSLLNMREEDRQKARQSWTAIQSIKELKEGYMSQVVRKICDLVIRYDAVIAMEDLNGGFKNSRKKVEKQVYQNFEKALIGKLNYLVNKQTDPEKPGGLLEAYQLTEEFESFQKMGLQNGFIFYIPAWLTSKIDPVTGFADLLRPKYESVETSRNLIENMDAIWYDRERDMFCFAIDYTKYPGTTADYRKKWTVYTNGDRIRNVRDENGIWRQKKVLLTEAFKKLLQEYGVAYENGDLRESLTEQEEKGFWQEFVGLLALTLQMRNSLSGGKEDYLISPVPDSEGRFFDSRIYEKQKSPLWPKDADANGAYHIARKAQWAIETIQNTADEDLPKAKISISKAEWLRYVQNHG